MKIKQSTIDNYRNQVESLINQKLFKEALDIAGKYPLKIGHDYGYVICKTRMLSKYQIKSEELDTLNQYFKTNPHYKSANEMILFLEDEVKQKFKLKTKKNGTTN